MKKEMIKKGIFLSLGSCFVLNSLAVQGQKEQ